MRNTYRAERNYLIHPSFIALTLLLAGVTALFLSFCGSYIYHRVQMGLKPVNVPILFYVNTIFLMASSYTLILAKKAYKADDTQKYKQYLGFTLGLTVLFMIAQYFAWVEMFNNNIAINHSTLASYLYMISAVHFAHVGLGIPFLAYFLWIAHTKMKEPISVLLYFSDKQKERRLRLLNVYWHFLDVLWIFLVLFFVINLLF
jgi:cytochrome c oxidase subunit III